MYSYSSVCAEGGWQAAVHLLNPVVTTLQRALTRNTEQIMYIVQNRSDWQEEKVRPVCACSAVQQSRSQVQTGTKIYSKEFSGTFAATGLVARTRVKASAETVVQTVLSPEVHGDETDIENLEQFSAPNGKSLMLQVRVRGWDWLLRVWLLCSGGL